jgi:hypothetical protein
MNAVSAIKKGSLDEPFLLGYIDSLVAVVIIRQVMGDAFMTVDAGFMFFRLPYQ